MVKTLKNKNKATMQTQNGVFVQTATFNAHMLIALKQKVYELLQANNTITTLEVKLALRKSNTKDTWNQVDVSRAMQFMADNGELTFHDNGTYRTYSMATTIPAKNSNFGSVTLNGKPQQPVSKNVIVPKTTMGKKLAKVKAPKAPVKKETIGKNKALQVIQGTNNKFFGVTFTKKDNTERKMTCRIDKNDLTPTALGYLRVIDTVENVVKNLNLQTLSEIRTNNTIYKIR